MKISLLLLLIAILTGLWGCGDLTTITEQIKTNYAIPDPSRDHSIFQGNPFLLPLDLILLGILLFIAIYHTLLYLHKKEDKFYIIFAVLTLAIAGRVLSEGGKALFLFFPAIEFYPAYKTVFFTYYIIPPLYMLYLCNLYPGEGNSKIMSPLMIIGFIFSAIVLIFPKPVYYNLRYVYDFYLYISIFYCLMILIKQVKAKNTGALFHLTGFIIFVLTGLNDIFHNLHIIRTMNISPYGYFFLIFFNTIVAAENYSKAFEKSQRMGKKLEARNLQLSEVNQELYDLNINLEDKVEERTKEIKMKKNQLEATLEKLKSAQEQLIVAEKMKSLGELVAGISHEINTPVGVCVTTASQQEKITRQILGDFDNRSARKEDLDNYFKRTLQLQDIMLKNLERTSELIRSFKMVSVDRASESRRSFNIKDYLQNILISLKPELKKTAVSINLECPPIILESYPGAFSQIITNLIMNSITHGFPNGARGSITITGEFSEKQFLLIFRDDGRGISNESKEKIFDPFFTTNRKEGNSGLGLHIIYNLVTQKLNGTITCESAPGAGILFKIKIPLLNEK